MNIAQKARGVRRLTKHIAEAANYVQHVGDGEPTNAEPMLGIAMGDSTETSSADGTVDVMIPIPGYTIMRAKATTVGNIDTAAELLGVRGDSVTFDRTGSTSYSYKIDENEADDEDALGLFIVGGDIDAGTLDFMLKGYASELHRKPA